MAVSQWLDGSLLVSNDLTGAIWRISCGNDDPFAAALQSRAPEITLAAPTAPCKRVKHIRNRPYPPRTNGKAERFIQTSLREWAYANAYASSDERSRAMRPWIEDYNHQRPHSALAGKPPVARLNNVLGNDT